MDDTPDNLLKQIIDVIEYGHTSIGYKSMKVSLPEMTMFQEN